MLYSSRIVSYHRPFRIQRRKQPHRLLRCRSIQYFTLQKALAGFRDPPRFLKLLCEDEQACHGPPPRVRSRIRIPIATHPLTDSCVCVLAAVLCCWLLAVRILIYEYRLGAPSLYRPTDLLIDLTAPVNIPVRVHSKDTPVTKPPFFLFPFLRAFGFLGRFYKLLRYAHWANTLARSGRFKGTDWFARSV